MANNNNGGSPGLFGFDPSVGVNSIQSLTLGGTNTSMGGSASQSAYTTTAATGGTSGPRPIFGEPLAVWIGFIFILLIIKFFSERPKTNLNPAYIKIGGLNVLTIGASAAIFIILMKVIFNKVHVYGFTDFANAL